MAECAEKAIIHKKHAGLIVVQKAAFLTQNLILFGKFPGFSPGMIGDF